MSIEKQEMDLIIREVEKRYKSDRAFYHGVLNQRSWDRLKTGESSLWNTSLKSYRGMMGRLFTDYEQLLISKSRQIVQMNMKGYSDNLQEVYQQLKFEHANYMVNQGAQISVNSAFESFPGDERINQGTSLKIEDELGNVITFTISIPSHQVPSGRKNRKEWFNEEFEKVVVL